MIANEFAQQVLERRSEDLSAWPKADQRHPMLYLAYCPADFARAEPVLQLRLHPLLGLLGSDWLRSRMYLFRSWHLKRTPWSPSQPR